MTKRPRYPVFSLHECMLSLCPVILAVFNYIRTDSTINSHLLKCSCNVLSRVSTLIGGVTGLIAMEISVLPDLRNHSEVTLILLVQWQCQCIAAKTNDVNRPNDFYATLSYLREYIEKPKNNSKSVMVLRITILSNAIRWLH